MKLDQITSEEIQKKVDSLESKATPLRLKILKECDELEVLYREIVLYKKELVRRENEKKQNS